MVGMTNHRHEFPNHLLAFRRPASAEAEKPAHCGAELRADYSPVASENRSATASSGCEYIAPVSDTESYAPIVSGSVLELNDNRAMLGARLPRGVIDAAADAEAKKAAGEAEAKAAAAHQPAECAPDAADSRRYSVARTQPGGPRNEQQPAASALAGAVRGARADHQALEAVEDEDADEDEGNSWDRAQAYNDYLRECDV